MVSAYRENIDTHGLGHKAFFYLSEGTHAARLSQFSSILHLIIKANDSVLDVGCGIGDVIPYLPPCVYKGIDIVGECVEKARKRYSDLTFSCMNVTDVTEQHDWIIILGITGTAPMPEVIIKKTWELARKGIVVDFLDSQKVQRDELNTYKMGACTEFFLDMGAQRIELYRTRNSWNIYLVHKQSLWI